MRYSPEHMAKLRAGRWNGHWDDIPDGYRPCTACLEILPFSEFHKLKHAKFGINVICKKCRQPLSKKHWKEKDYRLKVLQRAKSRATQKGMEFDIELEDINIPDICPVLGISMDIPSLDRIDNSKGYVKGNVRVISNRANLLKLDATVEEMRLILADLERIEAEKNK